MFTLFTPRFIDSFVLAIAPYLPQPVQQFAYQLETKAQLWLDALGSYLLVITGLHLVLLPLLSSLLVLLNRWWIASHNTHLTKPVNTSSKCLTDTYTAKANRAALRLLATQIRVGQLSN